MCLEYQVPSNKAVYQANSGSRMGQINAESYESPEHLKTGIEKSKKELTRFRPEKELTTKTTETKASSQTTNTNCPQSKPTEVKPRELTDREKLEVAKKEKEALFKELKESQDIKPQEAITKLKEMKSTFTNLDDAFRLKISTNQEETNSYKPSHHTDIDGNNGKADDEAFYAKHQAITAEYIGLRSDVNAEMRSINNKVLQQEMRFLRA
jgi:hypothetical protein